MSRPGHKRLGESLVDSGAITLEQLNDALAVQRRTGERLGRALVKLGYTTDAVIAAGPTVPVREVHASHHSNTARYTTGDIVAAETAILEAARAGHGADPTRVSVDLSLIQISEPTRPY